MQTPARYSFKNLAIVSEYSYTVLVIPRVAYNEVVGILQAKAPFAKLHPAVASVYASVGPNRAVRASCGGTVRWSKQSVPRVVAQ